MSGKLNAGSRSAMLDHSIMERTRAMDGTAPLSPVTAPARWYRGTELWPLERKGVFARSWQFLGHESSLSEPGAYVADVIAGFPVLVIRGDDGQLRGFHNVCRHRAGPLVEGGNGRCEKLITCRYHGWSYTFDGRLRAARDFGRAADFDPREFSLFPVRVETWRGLVFVAIDQEIEPLARWVEPLERRLAGNDLSGLSVALVRAHPIACNWKTYVENYLEGYHVRDVHPALDREIDSDRYTVSMEGRVALHEAPLRTPGAVYGGLWAWMWPNLGINVYGKGLMLERMSPVGPGATRLDYVYLMPAGEEVSQETLALSEIVTEEDRSICERVQQNLDAGVYDTGRLSPKHEIAVAAFQAWVGEAVAG
jgi:choline monooxygenase